MIAIQCGNCQKPMTPENSSKAPEMFLCDECVEALVPTTPTLQAYLDACGGEVAPAGQAQGAQTSTSAPRTTDVSSGLPPEAQWLMADVAREILEGLQSVRDSYQSENGPNDYNAGVCGGLLMAEEWIARRFPQPTANSEQQTAPEARP